MKLDGYPSFFLRPRTLPLKTIKTHTARDNAMKTQTGQSEETPVRGFSMFASPAVGFSMKPQVELPSGSRP